MAKTDTDTDPVESEPTPLHEIKDNGVISLSVLNELITTGRIEESTKEVLRDALDRFHGDNPRVDPSEAVPEGSASLVLDWVDEDPDRARLALDLEASRDRPRKALTEQLKAIADPDDDDTDQEV